MQPKKKKTIYKTVPAFLPFLFIFASFYASALEIDYPAIGGENPGGGAAEFIRYIFLLGVGIAGLFTLGSLLYGVFLYVTSEIIPTKQAAKERMTEALIGFGLVLGAVVILWQINPALVNLGNPLVNPVVMESGPLPIPLGEITLWTEPTPRPTPSPRTYIPPPPIVIGTPSPVYVPPPYIPPTYPQPDYSPSLPPANLADFGIPVVPSLSPTCGENGIDNSNEECDGTDFGTETCESRGFSKGDLICRSNCTIDDSSCPRQTPQNIIDITLGEIPGASILGPPEFTVEINAKPGFDKIIETNVYCPTVGTPDPTVPVPIAGVSCQALIESAYNYEGIDFVPILRQLVGAAGEVYITDGTNGCGDCDENSVHVVFNNVTQSTIDAVLGPLKNNTTCTFQNLTTIPNYCVEPPCVLPPPDTSSPSGPSGLNAVVVSSSQINLLWNAPPGSPAGYSVYRNGIKIAETSSTSYSNSGLLEQTAYQYRVSAFDSSGNLSQSSATITATTLKADSVSPSVPFGLSGSAISSQQINLFWTPSSDNSGNVGYDIYRNGAKIAEAGSAFYMDTGLLPSTTYNYYVSAFDGSGNLSSASATFSIATIATAPAPDTTLPTITITSPLSGSSVSSIINISASPADNAGIASVQFRLDGVNLGQPIYSAPYSVSWNTIKTANGGHTLTAVARDTSNNSQTSVAISVTVNNILSDTTPPSAPSGVIAKADPAPRVDLSWTPSNDNIGVIRYDIYRNGIKIAQTSTTSYSDTTVQSLSSYSYSIAAVDLAGNISFSSSAGVMTTCPLKCPTHPGSNGPVHFTIKDSCLLH